MINGGDGSWEDQNGKDHYVHNNYLPLPTTDYSIHTLVCRMQGGEQGGGDKVMLRKLSSAAGHNELPAAASDGPGICK